MSRTLYVRVSGAAEALDRFEAAWHLATGRKAPPPLAVLSFADLPLLLKTLTPARWELLRNLRSAGACTIFALAKRLSRDYKNVHTDVTQLMRLGLIARNKEAEVEAAWDAIRADLRL